MQHLSIRFLIGLSKRGDAAPGSPEAFGQEAVYDDRADRALAILAHHYPAFSAVRGTGYWQRAPESNLVVEAIVTFDGDLVDAAFMEGPAIGRAQSIAGKIAQALDQESVALVVVPVRFSLEGQHATEG